MKLMVLDGNSLVNRAFFGIKLLTTKDGRYTNAIYGFQNILLNLLAAHKPDAVAIAWDERAPTFRHNAYDGYKATRHGMPEELAQQMPVLKELLTDLGFVQVSKPGWEADDILGTLAAANEAARRTGEPAMAIQLPDGRMVTGKTSELMGCSAAALLNALKSLAGLGGHGVHLIAQSAIQPIQTVKVQYLGSNNPRLHSDEVLIALAASANLDPKAARALEALAHLQGCQAHCSVILSPADEGTYRKLGIQLTCEPKYQTNKLYHR